MSDSDPLAPQQPHGELVRCNLLQLLDCSQDHLVTLLLAPAGSGKSTLLRQWVCRRPATGTAMLTLSARDQDESRFFYRLSSALHQAIPRFDSTRFNPLDTGAHATPESIADSLMSGLSVMRSQFTLVIDDLHLLSPGIMLDTLNTLIRRAPDNLHLVISSRTQPALPLTYLKLNHQLLEIGPGDLQATKQDAAALQALLNRPPLPPHSLDRLMSITEGWMAGLRLALLCCGEKPEEALAGFNGSQPDVVAYFADAVLSGLPDHLRNLFLQSSLLDSFDGALCDALTLRMDSALLLEQVARQELFLNPVEHQPGRYRYHPLLRDFLQNRLQVEHPGTDTILHQRAAHHMTAHNELDNALQHAQLSGNQALFTRLLHRAFQQWTRQGSFNRILAWEEALSGSSHLLIPDIAVPLICTLTLSRQFDRATAYLHAFKAQPAATEASAKTQALTATFLGLYLELFQNDTDFLRREDLEELLRVDEQHPLRSFTRCMVAYHHLQHARLDAALRQAMLSREELLQQGHQFMAAYVDLIIALCNRSTGNLGTVIKDVQRAYDNPHESAASRTLRTTAMIVVLYEQNRLTEARRHCDALLPQLNTTSATEVIVTVYLTCARILHMLGESTKSRNLLAKLQGMLRTGNYERFQAHLAAEVTRQAWVTGNRDLMSLYAKQFQLADSLQQGHWDKPQPYSETWERRGLAVVYWLLSSQRHDAAERILRVLAHELDKTGLLNRLVVVEACLIVSQYRKSADDAVQASALNRLLEQRGLLSLTRSVYDEAPGFGLCLGQAAAKGLVTLPSAYQEAFKDLLLPRSASPNTPRTPLTYKEQAIYQHLLAGLSNRDISERMGITVATTKWHLKNIYQKLQITNRTEALLRHNQHIKEHP